MKALALVAILVAVLGVGWLATSFLLNKDLPSARNQTQDDQFPFDSNQEAMVETTGDSRYVEYSKDNLEKSSDKRRVLFFYANWCPTCRPADADFKANLSSLPNDVVVIRVNYNDDETDTEEKALADKYKVTYQHTFVQIDENGEVLTRWNGGDTEKLLDNIK